MKIFIDTANVEEIRIASKYGVIKGVTTNPSLIAKEGRKLEDVIHEIVSLVDGPISAEVKEADAETMIKQARELHKIHDNIVIKIPMTMEGIKAVSVLSKENIKTNVTLVFSIPQAIMACEAGASYISPFMGRMDDMNASGVELIKKMVLLKKNYNYKTEIIAASIRNTLHLEQAALAGSDIATVPFKVINQSVIHPLTTNGLKIFDEAAKKNG